MEEVPARARAYGTGRIKCGTESNGGFINIAISNCVFEGCQGYALESVDGALLEDITITNTTMRDLVSGPIFMRLGARLRGPKETTKVGTLKRILISNLECYNAPKAQARSSAAFPATPLKTSSSPTSTSKPPAARQPKLPRSQPPEQEDNYPEPSSSAPARLRLLPAPHAQRRDEPR